MNNYRMWCFFHDDCWVRDMVQEGFRICLWRVADMIQNVMDRVPKTYYPITGWNIWKRSFQGAYVRDVLIWLVGDKDSLYCSRMWFAVPHFFSKVFVRNYHQVCFSSSLPACSCNCWSRDSCSWSVCMSLPLHSQLQVGVGECPQSQGGRQSQTCQHTFI